MGVLRRSPGWQALSWPASLLLHAGAIAALATVISSPPRPVGVARGTGEEGGTPVEFHWALVDERVPPSPRRPEPPAAPPVRAEETPAEPPPPPPAEELPGTAVAAAPPATARPPAPAPEPAAEPPPATVSPPPPPLAAVAPAAHDEGPGAPGADGPAVDDPGALRPVYPASCRRRGHEGTAVVRVEVGADGTPLKVEIVRSAGCPELDQAALDAARRARFRPARRWGRPVAAALEQPFRFVLRR
jgi:protein TonB